MVKKKNLLPLKKQALFLDWTSKQLGKCLIYHKSMAIKHLPDKEKLIDQVFRQCVLAMFMMKKSNLFKDRIFYTLEFPPKNKWMTFLDKLNISNNQNMLSIHLFQTLVLELTSKEKAYKEFWTVAYKELSEKLLLPTEIDYVDSHSNSLNPLYKKQEDLSKSLILTTTPVQKKNYLKTCYQLSTSSIADKWEKEVTKLKTEEEESKKLVKTIKIKLYPTQQQKQVLDSFIDTHRFVYNRTLEYTKQGYEPNFENLRNMLATERTRSAHTGVKCINTYLEQLKIKYKNLILTLNKDNKEEYKIKKENIKKEQKFIEKEIEQFKKEKFSLLKNPLIYDFELNTSNEIKSNAIKSVCDAYKSGFSNLRNGTIKYFNMKFKKKNEKRKCIELAKSDIHFFGMGVKITPTKFQNGEEIIKINKKNLNKYKDLQITHNTDLTKVNGIYYIHVLVDYKIKQEENKKDLNFCGIDPGVRTFVSIYGNMDISTIDMKDPNKLEKLNNKIKFLKTLRIRKKKIIKIEKRKEYIIDEMHWNICNYLIKSYDVIFFGDIKSHNIVKKSYNKTLNRKFNDLKFYKFKQRLLYKGIMNNKKVFFINEAFTSQGCSTCGNLWKELGKNKIYTCQNKLCKKVFDRDYNAAKNICMKGILINN